MVNYYTVFLKFGILDGKKSLVKFIALFKRWGYRHLWNIVLQNL